MQHEQNMKNVPGPIKGLGPSFIKNKKQALIFAAAVIIFIIAIVLLHAPAIGKHSRTETYKEATGSAGFEAHIDYGCDKEPCSYDFNVYIFNEQGHQVSVLRPSKDGKVGAALSEGNYIMLIGKQFGNDALFPQELLKLKNAQLLELKLQYKEAK